MVKQKQNEPTQLDRIETMLILLCEQLLEDDPEQSNLTLDDSALDDLDAPNPRLNEL